MNTEQERTDFEAWAIKNRIAYRGEKRGVCFYDGQRNAYWEGWKARASLQSPEVQELIDALQEVIDAADGDGWNVLDPSFEKQRAALAAMEKQK